MQQSKRCPSVSSFCTNCIYFVLYYKLVRALFIHHKFLSHTRFTVYLTDFPGFLWKNEPHHLISRTILRNYQSTFQFLGLCTVHNLYFELRTCFPTFVFTYVILDVIVLNKFFFTKKKEFLGNSDGCTGFLGQF